jgi:hypothetical protein
MGAQAQRGAARKGGCQSGSKSGGQSGKAQGARAGEGGIDGRSSNSGIRFIDGRRGLVGLRLVSARCRQKAGDEYRAAELQRAAEYGQLKATQVTGQLTRNLNVTLGHIDAIRAAAHTDPSSPTGAAVRDYTEQVGTEQRGIEVANIEEQARTDEAAAAYMRFAGSQALLAGDIGAGADILGSFRGPAQSGGAGYSLLKAAFPG